MDRPGNRPGRVTPFTYIRTAAWYVHIALATVLIGIWGAYISRRDGYLGAHRTCDVWSQHLLDAARWYMGLSYELRGTAPTGNCLIGAKHQSFFDILIIARNVPRRCFIMKKQVLHVPIMGWFAMKAGCIPIDRSRGHEAMGLMLSEAKAAHQARGLGQLIVYPEGTRTRPGEKRKYKYGIAGLYQALDLPCVPAATNVGLFWNKKGMPIRSGHAVVEFLPAIEPGLPPEEMLAQLETMVEARSDALMAEAGFGA
ncbi:lysophospholipid acyltransferase family protein [Paracoccus sp. p4-l81]